MNNAHPIRQLLSFLAALLFVTSLFAQQRWEAIYQDDTFRDDIFRIAPTAGGEYLAFMVSQETANGQPFRYVARIAANGEMLELDTSVQAYGGYPYPHLFPQADGKTKVIAFWENNSEHYMATAYFTPGFQYVWTGSPTVPFPGKPLMLDGNSVVVARKENGGFKLFKSSLAGDILWENEAFEPSGNWTSNLYHDLSLFPGPDGSVFVSATFQSFQNNTWSNWLAIAKFSADGTKEWATWTPNISGPHKRTILAGENLYSLIGSNLLRHDAQGGVLWTKYLPATPYQNYSFTDIAPIHDGQIMLTGTPGTPDMALMKLDTSGTFLWEKRFGANIYTELPAFVQHTPDHGFLIAGNRHYGSVSSTTPYDAYLVKTDSAGGAYSNLIRGKVFHDLDGDCAFDPGEPGLENKLLKASFQQVDYYRQTGADGTYSFPVGDGQTLVKVGLVGEYYAIACTVPEQNVTLNSGDTIDFDAPLAFVECPLMTVDLAASLLRRCFGNSYIVSYCNLGTAAAENVVVKVFLDGFFDFTSASHPYTNVNPLEYIFEIGTVQPGECGVITIHFNISCAAVLGQEHCTSVTVEPDTVCVEDPYLLNDPPYFERDCQWNIGSYDPNDKVTRAGTPDSIGLDSVLKYLVRFQNTGTDTAFTVVIADTLSQFLEPLSIQLGASSHAVRMELHNHGVLKFIFDNILLPDSTTNEEASHGFVQFKIQQRPALPRYTPIRNRAGIYFDFNEPVLTNTTLQKVDYPEHPRHNYLTLCAGESFMNQPLFADTALVQTLLYPTFDSVITTHITVLPVFETALDTIVPFGAMLGDLPVFAEGNYQLTLLAENGCDSTLLLHATPLPPNANALIAGDKSPCQLATVNYGVPMHPDAIYTWSVGGGILAAGQGTHLVAVEWTGNQLGTISLEIALNGEIIPIEPVLITILPNEFTMAFAVADPLCFGLSNGAIDLTPAGTGAPFNYHWNNGINTQDIANLPAGTYSVTLTAANGCSQSASAMVTEPPVFSVQIASIQPTVGLSDGSISLTIEGATPPYSLDWGNGFSGNPLTGLPVGTYPLLLTDANGCIFTQTIVLEGITANQEALEQYELSLLPNPVLDHFELRYRLPEAGSVSIEVLNALGQTVAVLAESEWQGMGEHRYLVRTTDWSGGGYFVRMEVLGRILGIGLIKI